MTRLHQLQNAGVSIWLDTLSRELLESGEFGELVREYAVTGATSNPTIFAKAITGSNRYDEQLRAALTTGVTDTQELFFEVALEDVRRAAELLRPIHAATAGHDGFVSFECTPDLADDTRATIGQARDLRRRLDLPNVMIKVPATEAGVPAIEELTADGVNVNVTLLAPWTPTPRRPGTSSPPREGRASYSIASPLSSSVRAYGPSATPTANCSTASTASGQRFARSCIRSSVLDLVTRCG